MKLLERRDRAADDPARGAQACDQRQHEAFDMRIGIERNGGDARLEEGFGHAAILSAGRAHGDQGRCGHAGRWA